MLIKHIDEGFIADFVEHVRKTSGKEKMFCVGEFWKDRFVETRHIF